MPHRYVEEMAHLPYWLPRGWQALNLRECVTCTHPSGMNKCPHSGDITRSTKHGYHWPHKKDSCPSKFLEKKESMPRPPGQFLSKERGILAWWPRHAWSTFERN